MAMFSMIMFHRVDRQALRKLKPFRNVLFKPKGSKKYRSDLLIKILVITTVALKVLLITLVLQFTVYSLQFTGYRLQFTV